MDVKEALEIVIKECPDPYAKTYAKAALELGGSQDDVIVETDNPPKGFDFAVGIAHKKTGNMMTGKELEVQILYVLSNTQYWRGPRAKEVKQVLKVAR